MTSVVVCGDDASGEVSRVTEHNGSGEPWEPRLHVETPVRDVVVGVLLGEFDITSDRLLRESLVEAAGRARAIVVDLSQAEFVDAATLHAIRAVHERLRTEGCALVLQLGTREIVRLAIEVSGLADAIPCAVSREEALRRASRGAGL
jgi:anti-anti-sigma factor